jgi:hypothetical protein
MVQIRITPPDLWFRTSQELKEFEPALFVGLRREIKGIGDEAADEVRKTVRLPPPTDGSEGRGSREEIASNTKATVSFTKRSAGVKIRTKGGALGAFPAGYNKARGFRHRVFGTDKWVQQAGRPFFGASIEKVALEQWQQRMSDAIDTANKAIGAHGE